MIDMRSYLETRFREYFRDAIFVAIKMSDEDNETTEVRVTIPLSEDSIPDGPDLEVLIYICEPGSDDDYFIFQKYEPNPPYDDDGGYKEDYITIPFPEGIE